MADIKTTETTQTPVNADKRYKMLVRFVSRLEDYIKQVEARVEKLERRKK
jgi:hypothetical protein